MGDTLIRRARHAPGWADWARRQAAADELRAQLGEDDITKLARIVGVFVDSTELAECVDAIRSAGFHR